MQNRTPPWCVYVLESFQSLKYIPFCFHFPPLPLHIFSKSSKQIWNLYIVPCIAMYYACQSRTHSIFCFKSFTSMFWMTFGYYCTVTVFTSLGSKRLPEVSVALPELKYKWSFKLYCRWKVKNCWAESCYLSPINGRPGEGEVFLWGA